MRPYLLVHVNTCAVLNWTIGPRTLRPEILSFARGQSHSDWFISCQLSIRRKSFGDAVRRRHQFLRIFTDEQLDLFGNFYGSFHDVNYHFFIVHRSPRPQSYNNFILRKCLVRTTLDDLLRC